MFIRKDRKPEETTTRKEGVNSFSGSGRDGTDVGDSGCGSAWRWRGWYM